MMTLHWKFRMMVSMLLGILLLAGCGRQQAGEGQGPSAVEETELLHSAVQQLTDVMVHDIFSPPVASRVYAYPSIAAYEVLTAGDAGYRSLAGQLHDLQLLPPLAGEIHRPLAAMQAYLQVGKALVFSEDRIEGYRLQLVARYRDSGMDTDLLDRSLSYGDAVAAHILAWADGDRYKETRTYPKYSINEDPDRWQPTPPAYMDAIEPHWNQIRPFALDSANQFAPVLATEFDMAPESTFYKELLEVYEVGNTLSDEQREIAAFWDCNPYVAHQHGHVMYATKKITPGGHWIGITKIATRQAGLDLMQTAMVYAKVSITMADAFISCWDEKYRSNLIRPETLINQHIDENWKPTLQTPPFPEYTSGHSVVSGSAAVALTSILGDSFAFIDSTEVKYGLPVRTFASFNAASEEAAISRLYGGIHYMPAIENGIAQGRALGHYVVDKLRFKEETAPKPAREESQAQP